MRIGILQADSVMDQFQPTFGNYPGMFQNLLGRDESIIYTNYDVEHGQYPSRVDECDGYVMTGSRYSVYDDQAWIHRLKRYVVELHETRSKLIGVCFGHQMVAEALGGKTEAAAVGWRAGISRNDVLRQESFMTPCLDSFNLVFMHQDQVTKLPPGAALLASSPQCPNAMFRLDDHILAIQGHPEFSKKYSQVLIELRAAALGEETFARGMASLAMNTDEKTVARWIVNFIAGPVPAGNHWCGPR